MAQQLKKKYLSNNSVDESKIKLGEGGAIRAVHNGQEVELIKPVGGKVQVLGSEVELKSSSEAKLVEAKAYADSKVAELTNLAPEALNTFKEIADQLAQDESAVAAVVSSVSSVQSALNQEISNRQAADAGLQSQINTAVSNASGSLSSDLSTETSARIAADSVLDGKIETEKTRAMGVETTISQNLANESSARQSADSALDGRVTSIEGALPGKASKSYVDSTFETKADHATDKSALEASIASEASRAQAAESSLSTSISNEVSNRQSDVNAKLVEAKSYADSVGSAKLTEAKSYTDSEITKLTNLAPSTLDTFKEVADALANSTSDVSALTVSLSNEVSRAQSAESALDARLDTIEGSGAGSIAKSLQDAKDYADTKKTEAQSYADSAVAVEKSRAESAEASITSSLNSEISRAQTAEALAFKKDGSVQATGGFNMGGFGIGNLPTSGYPSTNGHASTKKYVDDQKAAVTSDFQAADATITSNLNSEISRAQSAESALSGRVSTLEAVKKKEFDQESFTFGSNGVGLVYVELSRTVLEKSIIINVNRLGMNFGEDYTVSIVGGKTRITWTGSVASGGLEAHENGQKCFVSYAYEV